MSEEKEFSFYKAISESFDRLLEKSAVIDILFYAFSFLVIFFFTIQMVRLYGKKVIGGNMEVQDFLRPLVVVLLIVFWKWIYSDILTDGFDTLIDLVTEKISLLEKNHEKNKFKAIVDSVRSGKINVLSLTIETFLYWLLKSFLLLVNIIFDTVITLYVGTNELILGIIAPIVLGFLMFDETKGIFIQWLKYFIFFKIFLLLNLVANHLGIFYIGVLSEVVTETAIKKSFLVLNFSGPIIFLCYLIFKILFITGSYNILQSLLGIGESGIGGASKSMSQSVVKGIRLIAAK